MNRDKCKAIGVGIVGAGRPNISTSVQIPACQASDRLRLVAICDRLPSVHDIARKAGVRSYTDYRDLLDDPEVEMVQVATPDWCHVDQAEAALALDKHVLLQKPPCTDFEGLARLRRAASRSRGRLKVLLNTREGRLQRSVRQLLLQGAVGDLVHVAIHCRGHRFPVQDPDSPYLRSVMGGVWIHNGLHWLDEAVFYAQSSPRTVYVVSTRNAQGPPELLGEGPNYWLGRFTLGSGVTVALEVNTMLMADGLPGGMQRVLIGTEGELRQPFGDDRLVLYRKGEDRGEGCDLEDGDLSAEEDTLESFRRAFDAFAEEIRTEHAQPPVLDRSLLCMHALIAGAEHANREVVDLPGPEQEVQSC